VQFIDYHNAYIWMPLRIEVLRPLGATTASSLRPAAIALRQSVLNLFGNQICTTDQGQTLYNDTNTFMINNLRLEIENDLPWLWSEAQDLNYSLDRTAPLPDQNLTSYSTLSGPSYAAFQGLEAGAMNGTPLTNDLNEFGNNTLGVFTFTYGSYTQASASPLITALNGTSTNAASGTNGSTFLVTFSDGRQAQIPFTSAGSTAPGGVLTLGGVTISTTTANATLAVTGAPAYTTGQTWVENAIGWTTVLDQSLVPEEVTIPIGFIALSATTAAINSIGGHALIAAGETAVTGYAYGQLSGRNPNFNAGFLDRVTVFQNDAKYVNVAANGTTPGGQTATNGADVWYYVARIPLKLLHDYWMQLNFPIINVGFNMQLYFNQPNGVAGSTAPIFPAFQTDANSTLITGGTNVTANPVIYYGQDSSGGNACRLYYRTVKFSPADNAKAAQMLTTGFTKSIKFISTDWNPMQTYVGAPNQITQYQITNSVVHPLRVWILAYLVNTAATPLNMVQQPYYAPGVITGHFNFTNILINNVPYFRQAQQTFEEQWEQCKHTHHTHNRTSATPYTCSTAAYACSCMPATRGARCDRPAHTCSCRNLSFVYSA
jgi:hypothetical protein